ncbi:L-aminopeptidase DmpA [Fodinibius salinus]|uniref:L-aminopeptidase DmpA n=1 Tax=Fodinibius salinus TaxID=860790 RepID=A0A5D3YNZ2_9BACT|nr:P1 family peptidase [Fodinibius salinus]TYP93879.1 L-aminopeptidase DmpA [Fodinibius salinus]
MRRLQLLGFFAFLLISISATAQDQNLRQYGIEIGVMETDSLNAITDVAGVKVGHRTIIKGDSIRTGVTAIRPHPGNIFQQKVPAAVYVGNGFGKLAGSTQIEELGNLETPIILTNTLSVPTAADALIDYTFQFRENRNVRSVNPVVGETNDGYLNDIRGRHVSKEHVLAAIKNAKSDSIKQGNVGAGTGTIAFGFKGGIGTASRKLPADMGGYTVGVLVQSNFGGVLQISGVPIGKELNKYYLSDRLNESPDGSCMIIVATDAPLAARNLERLAKRAVLGLAKTGGIASNGSGDYIIAFSTAKENRISHQSANRTQEKTILKNNALSPLFMAVNEATEEAIINSLFQAQTMSGRNGHTINELPVDSVLKLMGKYGRGSQ